MLETNNIDPDSSQPLDHGFKIAFKSRDLFRHTTVFTTILKWGTKNGRSGP